jgi:hypothetical protein
MPFQVERERLSMIHAYTVYTKVILMTCVLVNIRILSITELATASSCLTVTQSSCIYTVYTKVILYNDMCIGKYQDSEHY